MTLDIEKIAYKYAIKNAYLHDGQCELKSLIGKIKALDENVQIKELIPILNEIIDKVNRMSLKDIETEYTKFEEEGYELKPKKQREGLIELDWADKEPVVTRFAPNPNGLIHLGHARPAIMSSEFAKKYGGKFILRFEDTDPKVKKPIDNPKELFLEDLNWLGCTPDEIYFASDRLEIYYDYMKKLVEGNSAYVCLCDKEEWRNKTIEKKSCPCRNLSITQQKERLEKMLNHTLKEGQAVLRMKTDLEHPDPSVRDWWIARIVDEPNHPKVGSDYHVWPSYMFQSAIDDHLMGVTLIIRGQEHSQNETKQRFLYNFFDWKYPHTFHIGRLSLGNMVLSTSKIKEGIENRTYEGWDDIRLGTIRALKRRGFFADAIKEIMIEVGVKPVDVSIDIRRLFDNNKKYCEPVADRASFLEDPIELDVLFARKMEVEKDGKKYSLKDGNQKFAVPKNIIDNVKTGEIIRLRNAYNVKITSKDDYHVQTDFVGTEKLKIIMLPWLLETANISIKMPDGTTKHGVTDAFVKNKNKGDKLYFDKLGFVVIDEKQDEKIVTWFTHP